MSYCSQFIHLNLHTEYSIADGIVRIDDLIETCFTAQMPAVAVTDLCNFFGLVKFYKTAMANGVKPLLGIDVLVCDKNNPEPDVPFRITLLALDQSGYKNLLKLISRAYVEGRRVELPVIEKSWLIELGGGIIVLSGGVYGDIGKALMSNDIGLAERLLQDWIERFADCFYLELRRTGAAGEENYISMALDLAERYQVPVVATNAVRFLLPQEFEAHEARVCINAGYVLDDPKRPRQYTEQQYLRSADEMVALFADIPEAISNTVEIAKRCNVHLPLGETFLPIFPVADDVCLESYFERQAQLGLEQRLATLFDITAPDFVQRRSVYDVRLALELSVIKKMGFSSYFLIVADFIQWAKDNGIPVGPGRGSGAGSLVAYVLGITGVDPIEHELLFERFLNPERVSLPDFDIDFCMEGRDKVIEYVMNRYGRDKVSQIITYGTMAARAVVRDVGRVLAFPYGFVDKIAKLIPFELGITLEKALQEESLQQRYNDEADVKTLIDLALKLEGITRNAGKHAGGVIIAPSVLTDFLPLYRESDDVNLVSQFDKDDVEAIGLVKFDFLGLRTLTIINWATQTINQKKAKCNESGIDISRIPLDDATSYKLLQSCATTAVFQLESRGMRDLIKRLQPDQFSDIVALVALYRPGPLQSGMVDDFIDRKHGRSQVVYLHPLLEHILKPTYGVILYQEQVMQIAQILAGYSLGSADILRRAMGKKKPEEMAKQRAIFLEGAEKQRVDKHVANAIFDLMEKFAGYGFNKSHSVAYALIAYQTAWLKAHYPSEFMAAVLSSDMDNTDKVVLFLRECEDMDLRVIPPDINLSDYKFTVADDGAIIFGLGAIKGVGAAALESILQARQVDGNFSDLFDFCKRIDLRKANKKVMEALIRAGALDHIAPNRGVMLASLPMALKIAEQHAANAATGQMNLFDDEDDAVVVLPYVAATELSDDERLKGEKSVLGFYISGHPIVKCNKELAGLVTAKISDIVSNDAEFARSTAAKNAVIAGVVAGLKNITTKTGNRMAIVTLEDEFASIDVTIFSELYSASRDLLVVDQLLVMEGELGLDNFSGQQRLRANKITTLEVARCARAKAIIIKVDCIDNTVWIENLYAALHVYAAGNCAVYLDYSNVTAAARVSLGDKLKVQPKDELLSRLKSTFGDANVLVCY